MEPPFTELELTLADFAGAPLPGAEVELLTAEGDEERAIADDAGRVRLRVPRSSRVYLFFTTRTGPLLALLGYPSAELPQLFEESTEVILETQTRRVIYTPPHVDVHESLVFVQRPVVTRARSTGHVARTPGYYPHAHTTRSGG